LANSKHFCEPEGQRENLAVAEVSLWQLAGFGLGSAFTVKLLDIAYQEIRRRFERSQTATRFVDEHLDPILKAADELVGKLHSLGREDFRSMHNTSPDAAPTDNNDLGGLIFLFARFWAQIEIFKREGLSIAISQDERGRQLESFFDCLESTRVRLIDRTEQRAIGETILELQADRLRTITYIEFIRRARTEETSNWLEPLRIILVRAWHTKQKQQLLQYLTVLHALIDTLDKDHLVTRARPTIPNKLTRQSWRDLNYRVFGVYLKFVSDHQKYLGPPRSGGLKGEARRRNF
jgi:hypothetical protein